MTARESPDRIRRRQGWNALESAHYAFSGLMWIAPRTASIKLAIAVSAALIGLGMLLRLALVEIGLLILAATLVLAVET
jgi:diacylglycerol kinase